MVLDPQSIPELSLETIFGSENYIDSVLAEARSIRQSAALFNNRYVLKQKVNRLSHGDLGKALDKYHEILDRMLGVYAPIMMARSLNYANSELENLEHRVEREFGLAYSNLMGFWFQLRDLDEHFPKRYHELLESRVLSEAQKKCLRDTAEERRNGLPASVEQTLGRLDSLLASSWGSLHEQLSSSLRFPFEGEELNHVEIRNIRTHDPDPRRRQAALEVEDAVLAAHAGTMALAYNQIVHRSDIVSRQIRHHTIHQGEWNIDNDIPDSTTQRFADALKRTAVSERYYAFKAKKLGKKKLDMHDIATPVTRLPAPEIPWDEAKDIVIRAFERASPQMGKLAQQMFDENRIDARTRHGKQGGYAFSIPTHSGYLPFIMMNYNGSVNDVITLAHEMGHAVHFMLSNAQQGRLYNHATTFTTEVCASVAEELAFDELDARASTPEERHAIHGYRIENTMETLMRGHLYTLAIDTHKLFESKRLSVDDLNAAYVQAHRDMYGKSVSKASIEQMQHGWVGRSHLFSSPFYLGDYPMTKLVALQIMDKYHDQKYHFDGHTFADYYEGFQREGSFKSTTKQLEEIGINVKHSKFWRNGLALVEGMVERFIRHDKKLEEGVIPKSLVVKQSLRLEGPACDAAPDAGKHRERS